MAHSTSRLEQVYVDFWVSIEAVTAADRGWRGKVWERDRRGTREDDTRTRMLHVLADTSCPSRSDRSFSRMSHVHICAACPCPCCTYMSVLQVRVSAACQCQCCMSSPCCMFMTMLHVHVDVACSCPCQCCMFGTMLLVYVDAPCSN
jgi:hypothetical protein